MSEADVATAGAFVGLLRQQNHLRHFLVGKRRASQQPMDAAMSTIDCGICKQLSYLAYVCCEVGVPTLQCKQRLAISQCCLAAVCSLSRTTLPATCAQQPGFAATLGLAASHRTLEPL